MHFKAILRSDTPAGIKLLAPGTTIYFRSRDSRTRKSTSGRSRSSEWSSTEWTLKLPADGALGTYQIAAARERRVGPARERSRTVQETGRAPDRQRHFSRRGVSPAGFSRRRDARRRHAIAGASLTGTVTAAICSGRPWPNARSPGRPARSPVLGADHASSPSVSPTSGSCLPEIATAEIGYRARPRAPDDARRPTGSSRATLTTKTTVGILTVYTFEGDVEDVSRQHIAGRATFRSIRRPGTSAFDVRRTSSTSKTDSRPRSSRYRPDGTVVAGVTVQVDAQADSVAQRAPRRRAGVLYVGDRRARRSKPATGRSRPPTPRFRCRYLSRRAAISKITAVARTPKGTRRRRRPVLLAGRRLYRVGTIRSQPHRPRSGEAPPTSPATRLGS